MNKLFLLFTFAVVQSSLNASQAQVRQMPRNKTVLMQLAKDNLDEEAYGYQRLYFDETGMRGHESASRIVDRIKTINCTCGIASCTCTEILQEIITTRYIGRRGNTSNPLEGERLSEEEAKCLYETLRSAYINEVLSRLEQKEEVNTGSNSSIETRPQRQYDAHDLLTDEERWKP